MKNNSDLFYTCSLIEYIGRKQKQRRETVVKLLGRETIRRIYRYADVFHCEPIAKTADDFIHICNIPVGAYDNLEKAKYEIPDYWTIGEVYERLIEDVSEDSTRRLLIRLWQCIVHGLAMPYPIIIQIFTINHGSISVSAIQKGKFVHKTPFSCTQKSSQTL